MAADGGGKTISTDLKSVASKEGSEHSGAASKNDRSLGSTASSEKSVSSLPAAIEESDWCGEERVTGLRCHHGYYPQRKVCWEGEHTGRRFLGCPLEDDDDQCHFIHWVDGEWEARVKKTIDNMWDLIARSRKREATTVREMQMAITLRNEAIQEKEAKLREKDQEMRRKEGNMRALSIMYERRLRSEVEEKNRAWFLVFCLVGLMVSMMFGFIVNRKK
ncbi:hypothetical protein ACP70R_000391 [Stipagrostis hirtigluma subsp. patula]